MKKIRFPSFIFLLLFLLSSTAFPVLITGAGSLSYAEDLKVFELTTPAQSLKLEIVTPDIEPKIARSGCCSWHGGVCDCIGGRIVCCDGTFSLSCSCDHDSNKDVLNSKE
jgi:hypothetical protein